MEYGALLENNPGALNVTWFSDEAYLHGDCYNNKKTVQPRCGTVLFFRITGILDFGHRLVL
jgi:hypothetical protein